MEILKQANWQESVVCSLNSAEKCVLLTCTDKTVAQTVPNLCVPPEECLIEYWSEQERETTLIL